MGGVPTRDAVDTVRAVARPASSEHRTLRALGCIREPVDPRSSGWSRPHEGGSARALTPKTERRISRAAQGATLRRERITGQAGEQGKREPA